MSILLVFDANDMEAVAALDQVTSLSLAERERGILEFRHGAATADQPEFAATLGAAGIVRIFFRKLGEISAGLDLLQHVVGFRAGVGDGFRVFLGAGIG